MLPNVAFGRRRALTMPDSQGVADTERRADDEDLVTDLRLVRVAQRRRLHARRHTFHLQQGDIGRGVGGDDASP